MEDVLKKAESLAEEINKKQDAIKTAIESKASNEDLEKLKSEFNELTEKSVKSLSEQVEKAGVELAKIKSEVESREASHKKSFRDILKAGFDSVKEQITDLKNQKIKDVVFNMDLKAMTEAGNLTGRIPVATTDPGIAKTPDRPTFMFQIVRRSSTISNLIRWVERTARTGAATIINPNENTAFPTLEMDYEEFTTSVTKVAVQTKVSREMLEDVDFIMSEIENELMTSIEREVDNQMFQGTGLSSQLEGVDTVATAFAAGAFALAIPNANIYDVIRVAANQIIVAGNGAWYPTHVVLSLSDFTSLQLQKDADGNYLLPPWASENGTMIAGVKVIANANQTDDNFLIGDFSKATLWDRRSLEIRMWEQNEDDPSKDMVTFTGTWRGAFKVKGVDQTAFVNGVISTAITAITAP